MPDSTGLAIPSARVSFAIAQPSSTAGYFRDVSGLTADSAWTDTDGYAQDTFTLGSARGVYLVTATSDSNPIQKTMFYAYADGFDLAAKTWKLVAPNKEASAVSLMAPVLHPISTLLSRSTVYEWNENAGVNAGLYDYSKATGIARGRGYWIYDDTGVGVVFSGSSGFDTVTVSLTAGWHIIGTGEYFYIDWDSDVRFDTGSTKLTPAQAAAAGVINNSVYWYHGSGYYRGPDPLTPALSRVQLKPSVGFFMYTALACNMSLYPNPRSPAETATQILNQAPALVTRNAKDGTPHPASPTRGEELYGAGASKYTQSQPAETNWDVRFILSGGGLMEFQNYIGVKPSATDVLMYARRAPPLAAGRYLAMSFAGEDGVRKAASYVEPIRTAAKWDFQIQSDLTGQAVTLAWDNLQSIPEKFAAYLITPAGPPVDMRKSASFSFATNADGPTAASFSAIAGQPDYVAAFLAPPLDRGFTFAYPNPGPDGNSFVYFKHNVTAGDVRIKIFDVGGRLVRELTGSVSPIPWDTTNRFGQKLGSGVYLYIVEGSGARLVDRVAIVR